MFILEVRERLDEITYESRLLIPATEQALD